MKGPMMIEDWIGKLFFVDLPGTYDYEFYDQYFMNNIDPKTKLNIKGPFANLHWSFKVDNQMKS